VFLIYDIAPMFFRMIQFMDDPLVDLLESQGNGVTNAKGLNANNNTHYAKFYQPFGLVD